MQVYVKEGQKVVAGRIGSQKEVAGGSILLVTVKVGRSPEDWVTVRLTDRKDGSKGNKSYFQQYGAVGQYAVFVCNEVPHGEYVNLWAVQMELGPKPVQKEEKQEEKLEKSS